MRQSIIANALELPQSCTKPPVFFTAAVASSRGLSAGSGVLDRRGNNSIKKGGPVKTTICN